MTSGSMLKTTAIKGARPFFYLFGNKDVARGEARALPQSKYVFKVNFSRDILKCIILVTNFQKSSNFGALRPQRPLIFNFVELKLRTVIWPNFGFSSWFWRNRTYDVILVI